MNSVKRALISFWREDDGLTMVEYAIAGALVAAGAAAAFTLLGTNVSSMINYLAGLIKTPS